ncbi:MAG: MmcQ/YjbR family DNA-binding protein [Bacteroidetes bacterium]|nr:MmcQ/YjbR family DNA-binding protein [Bacteroidota bacterium]
MHLEDLRIFCLQLPGTTEETPFDANTLVFKVMGKMFCLTNIELFESINVKCDPVLAIELRERYFDVLPGYHMSKKHWNTVILNGEIVDQQLLTWIKDSYDLVVKSLTKKLREELANR